MSHYERVTENYRLDDAAIYWAAMNAYVDAANSSIWNNSWFKRQTATRFRGYGVLATADDFSAAANELVSRGYVLKSAEIGYDVYCNTSETDKFQACLVFHGRPDGSKPDMDSTSDLLMSNAWVVGKVAFVNRTREIKVNTRTGARTVPAPNEEISTVFKLTSRKPPSVLTCARRAAGFLDTVRHKAYMPK